MVAEAEHVKGKEGVEFARRWLNYTTRLDAPWTVYDNAQFTTLLRPDRTPHRFDLAGRFLDPPGRDFYAEVKKYEKQLDLKKKYEEFLVNCYAVTVHMLDTQPDRNTQFFWISWSPHSATRWEELSSPVEVRAACGNHPSILGGAKVADDMLQLVASRLWLLILSDKHSELMMRPEYFAHVKAQAVRDAT
ncbi:hypothetical protein ACGFNP_60045 [Nonomuraea sp. NPDC049269]|uniref:hypothetical protein n=1 Tax=Nonomuraea sp. NPDC049269 TaxID=3364349 RepID=UPI003722EA4E